MSKLPPFEDPQVQTAYAILCDDEIAPLGEHWEGYAARRIVASLRADAEADATIAQLLEALETLHTIYVREGAAVTPAAEIGEAWMRAAAAIKAAKGEA